MIRLWEDDEAEPYYGPGAMLGQAGTLPAEAADDIIERLHKAVEDVTGKPVERPAKPRMGFL